MEQKRAQQIADSRARMVSMQKQHEQQMETARLQREAEEARLAAEEKARWRCAGSGREQAVVGTGEGVGVVPLGVGVGDSASASESQSDT